MTHLPQDDLHLDAPVLLPGHRLELLTDLSPPEPDPGFLRFRRARFVVIDGAGERSAPFVYDYVERNALDAVVVVAWFKSDAGAPRIFLRSAIRPPAWLRPEKSRPFPEKASLGNLWEVPAGLVEPSECNADGLFVCAARELEEELGFRVHPDAMVSLGPSVFPSAGVIGERHHFFHVCVAPTARATPSLDGSVLEEHAAIIDIPLETALSWIRSGHIEDGKTEIALRRLAEVLL